MRLLKSMNLTLFEICRVASYLAARVLLACWLAVNLGVSNLAIAKSQQSAEWILGQKQCDKGKHTVFVCATAVKIVANEWQYQLIAKAPDWKVHCFRPSEKIEWTGDLDRFDGVLLSNPFSLPSKKTGTMSVMKSEEMLGLKCTKYLELPEKRTVMWAADDITVAPKGAEFLCRYYFIPQISKVPLRRVKDIPRSSDAPARQSALPWTDMSMSRDWRSGIVVNLDTTSCKQVPFNASDFEWPTGYQKVSIERVAYSRKMKDDMEMLGDNIGFATRTGSKSQKSGAK